MRYFHFPCRMMPLIYLSTKVDGQGQEVQTTKLFNVSIPLIKEHCVLSRGISDQLPIQSANDYYYRPPVFSNGISQILCTEYHRKIPSECMTCSHR